MRTVTVDKTFGEHARSGDGGRERTVVVRADQNLLGCAPTMTLHAPCNARYLKDEPRI
jgi:hypothetical protein